MPADEELPRIDVDAVLRRARASRRPRLLAAIAGGTLAVAAVAIPVVAISLPHGTGIGGSTASAPDLASPHTGKDDGAGGASAGIPRCGAPLASPAPAADGLVATVTPLTVRPDDRDIPVEVTLTNTGDRRLVGSTPAAPAITLSRGGIVVWHTSGPTTLVAVPVDLAPGAATTYRATLQPLVCAASDEGGAGLPEGLPAATPGDYELSASIAFTSATGSDAPVLVTGPAVRVGIVSR